MIVWGEVRGWKTISTLTAETKRLLELEISLSLHRGDVLALSSSQNGATLEDLSAGTPILKPSYSISAELHSALWLGQSRTSGLALVFLVLQNPTAPQLQLTTFFCRVFWAEFMDPSVMASYWGLKATKHPHAVTLPPPCFTAAGRNTNTFRGTL